jgi:hypothetical protein
LTQCVKQIDQSLAVEGDTVRIELNIKLSRSMMESEETILNTLNEAG